MEKNGLKNSRGLIILLSFVLIGIQCVIAEERLSRVRLLELCFDGFVQDGYTFNDEPCRNLKIVFVNDSVMLITNNGLGRNKDLSFQDLYLYKRISNYSVQVKCLMNTTRKEGETLPYILPFEALFKTKISTSQVFPLLNPKEAIRFSRELDRIQIREFMFSSSRQYSEKKYLVTNDSLVIYPKYTLNESTRYFMLEVDDNKITIKMKDSVSGLRTRDEYRVVLDKDCIVIYELLGKEHCGERPKTLPLVGDTLKIDKNGNILVKGLTFKPLYLQ